MAPTTVTLCLSPCDDHHFFPKKGTKDQGDW